MLSNLHSFKRYSFQGPSMVHDSIWNPSQLVSMNDLEQLSGEGFDDLFSYSSSPEARSPVSQHGMFRFDLVFEMQIVIVLSQTCANGQTTKFCESPNVAPATPSAAVVPRTPAICRVGSKQASASAKRIDGADHKSGKSQKRYDNQILIFEINKKDIE